MYENVSHYHTITLSHSLQHFLLLFREYFDSHCCQVNIRSYSDKVDAGQEILILNQTRAWMLQNRGDLFLKALFQSQIKFYCMIKSCSL